MTLDRGDELGEILVAEILRNCCSATSMPAAHCLGRVAVRAFPLADVQAMLGHAHVTTTMRYVHHRPGADDAAQLSRAFAGDSHVSPAVGVDAA